MVSLCLSLSLSQFEVALGADPGFIFLLNNDAAVWACLRAAGCPVPALGVAPGAPPPTNFDRLSAWLRALVVAQCNCTAAVITPDIVLVRASHIYTFNPQQTCTVRFIVLGLAIRYVFCHYTVHATRQPKVIPMGSVQHWVDFTNGVFTVFKKLAAYLYCMLYTHVHVFYNYVHPQTCT